MMRLDRLRLNPLVWLAAILLLAGALRFIRLRRLPPGLWFDEAWVSVQARELAAGRLGWPVYFAADFGGMHPAVVYVTAVARQLMHSDPLAIRYAIAVAGLAAIGLTFFALRAIWRLDPQTAPSAAPAALLGAGILSITFPFLIFTRVGLESMLPSIPAALAFWSVARTLHSGRRRDALLTGLCLGASLYTFDSARFLPLAVAGGWLWAAAARGRTRPFLVQITIAALAALVIFAPLGLYFAQHWEQFLLRAGVASYHTLGPGAASPPLAVLANLGRTLAGFSLPGFGDGLPRHNLPGRPIFDPFLSLLFWLGLWQLLRCPRRQSSALLLAWGGVMLLPVLLTDGAPTYTRILGALPALAGVAGAGAQWIVGQKAKPPAVKRLPHSLLAAGLAFSFLATGYDYFGRWAGEPGLFDAFQVGERQAAALARERLADGPVYLASDAAGPDAGRPTFDLLLRESDVRFFSGPGCLPFFDRSEEPVTYVIDALQDRETADAVRALFPTAVTEPGIMHPPSGGALFSVLTVPAGARVNAPQLAANARFGPLQLRGYDLAPATLYPGATLTVRLYWQAAGPPAAAYTVFLHLYPAGGEEGSPAAQSDAQPCQGGYSTSRWRPGEMVWAEHRLTIPPDFEGETAVLAAGVYAWPSLERLPLSGEDRALSGDRLRLAEVAVGRAP